MRKNNLTTMTSAALLLAAMGACKGSSGSSSPAPANTGASRLGFNAGVSELPATCGAVTVNLLNASGAVAPAGANVVLSWTSTDSSGAFYSDSACTSPLTTSTIAAGQSSATVYYKDSAAGSAVITAKDVGNVLTAATTTATISNNGSSSTSGQNHLAFLASSQSLAPSVCNPVAIALQNASAVTVSPTTAINITLSTSSAYGHFYSDVSCLNAVSATQLAPGLGQATVYYKDTMTGSATITANDASGLNTAATETVMLGSGSSFPGSLPTGTVTSIAGLHLYLTTTNASQVPGACNSLTLGLLNGAAPATFNQTSTVMLSSTSPTGAFYNDASCMNVVQGFSFNQGSSSTSVYYKDSSGGIPTLTATDTSNPGVAAGSTTLSAGATTGVNPNTQCWGVGIPSRAAFLFNDQASAMQCAQYFAAGGATCQAAVRVGLVSCSAPASVLPTQCTCPGGVVSLPWLSTPTGI